MHSHMDIKEPVYWIKFLDDSCKLLRVSRVHTYGLLLSFDSAESIYPKKETVLALGFREVPQQNSFFLPYSNQNYTKEWFEKLASRLEGEFCSFSQGEINDLYTIREPISPHSLEHKWIKPLGINAKGQEIFNYVTGDRYCKMVSKEGTPYFIIETVNQPHTDFLRVASLEDCPALTAGILHLALKHSISHSELKLLITNALEPFQWDPNQPSESEVFAQVQSELVKQLLQFVVKNKGDRRSYHKAMQMTKNLGDVFETIHPNGEYIHPNIPFLIFLRRLTQNFTEVDYMGSEFMGEALPFIKTSNKTSLQCYDFTQTNKDGLTERVSNTLQKREGKGQSIFLFEKETFKDSEQFRHTIGKSYSFEIVALARPEVITNHISVKGYYIVIIGDKRKQIQEEIPAAVLRTHSLENADELDIIYQEILRSKRRVKEWEKSLDGSEQLEYEKNEPQRIYRPLSKIVKSQTMIPKALEASTIKALNRITRKYGADIDAVVAGWMGMKKQKLRNHLFAEQVDAVAMAQCSFERDRGFLLADQTGVGKGRALAALALIAIKNGKKVVYFTENTEINIPDVWRDLKGVGALDLVKPMIIASKNVTLEWDCENLSLLTPTSPVRTVSAKKRLELFRSKRWPKGINLVLTNYSQFRGKADSESTIWAENAVDENTFLILDESQNAINPDTRTGAVLRKMLKHAGRSNSLFATATPMRDKHSADLYISLLPNVEGYRLDSILAIKFKGGESAQESFTSMLAEDGVYLRRDHDFSNIDFQVRLPSDSTMSGYIQEMNKFSELVEKILDFIIQVNIHLENYSGQFFQRLINEGVQRETAQAEIVNSIKYFSAGGPMSRLARLMINALKVDQVVQEVINEIKEGRKPLITFHSTGEMLLSELISKDPKFVQSEKISLTIHDQIRRITNNLYVTQVFGGIDFRQINAELQRLSLEIDELVEKINPDLPAFPIDSIIEKLSLQGISCGEITGRSLTYKNGRIERRKNYGRHKTIHDFNNGSIDVLIYNMAGATGGSYHASSDFNDQRPRTLIEMETPLDIIKYVQAQGRSNRYGQVSRPRIVSVMTGLATEMRILQQRNRKLRVMGASVDGNRSHPLLLDDIPDFINKIGDRASKQILETHPQIARRLGLLGRNDFSDDTGGVFANKVLSRSIVLSTEEQNNLIELIRMEFEAIIEELTSQNNNPLKPMEMHGNIEVKARTLFEGTENNEFDPDRSAFLSPLYIETGIHHFNEKPITSDELRQMVNKAIITDGAEGYKKYVDNLRANLPNLLQDLLDPSTTFEEALDRIYFQSRAFQHQYNRLKLLLYLLENLRPGVVIQYDRHWDDTDSSLRTVVKLNRPKLKHAYLPQSYRVHTAKPGDSKPRLLNLSRLMNFGKNSIRFQIGLSKGDNLRHLKDFNIQSLQERNYPVQILTGNHLAAIREAHIRQLGSISLYRNMDGTVHRGVVIDKKSTDLTKLPVFIPSSRAAIAIVSMLINREIRGSNITFKIQSGLKQLGYIQIIHRHYDNSIFGRFNFPLEKPVYDKDGNDFFAKESFYFKRPELGKLFRQDIDEFSVDQNYKELSYEWNQETFRTIFTNLDDLPLYCDHWHRKVITKMIENLDKGVILETYKSFLPIE